MAKRNSTQICLPNGSLEELNKCIYRKPVDLELWRRNIPNTILLYLPGMMARNFEDKTALLNTISLHNEYCQRTAGRRRGNTVKYIYWMTAGFLKTKRNGPPNTIYSRNKSDVLHLWIFQKGEIALAKAARESFSFVKNLMRIKWFQIKLETVWLPTHNAL